MNPKAKIAIPAIAALIFIVIDFVAPVQYLSYFHTAFNFATRQTNPISLMLARVTYIIFLSYLFAAVSGLLRNFRPRLRWGLSILSVVGTTSALTTLSLMISTSQAVNFTTLILNIMIVVFLLLAALLALLIWVRAKKEFDQRQADLEEEEVVVAPMPLTTEGADVAPVVPVTAEATPAVAAEVSEASAAPETPAAPQE
mgnify:FL=1